MKRSARHALRATAVCAFLAAAGLSTTAMAADSTRMIVSFKAGQGAAVKAAIAKAGGRVLVDLARVDAVAVQLPSKAVAALKRNAAIEAVEADDLRYAFRAPARAKTVKPAAVSTEAVPYGIPAVQADQVSFNTETAPKICIIDSGYDLGHEDLQTAGVTGTQLTTEGDWSTDVNGHGTHVAGTILGIGGNGKGVVGVIPTGTAPLHIAKVFDASGSAPSSRIIEGVLACQEAGAKIINMSLGGGRPNLAEARLYNSVSRAGILVVVAAGNGGNTSKSYPASYKPVLSVAAVDEANVRASFSQANDRVDLAGPGVDTLSTVPTGTGGIFYTTAGGVQYESVPMEGTPESVASGAMYDMGLGTAVDAGAAGKVCLISRGEISFADKVLNCQNSGGIAAVVYNNTTGRLNATLNGAATTIPSVGVTAAIGAAMKAAAPGTTAQVDTLNRIVTNYDYLSGTSMATPHVAAVAALVWSNAPQCTAAQISASLTKSAKDLGTAGYDNEYGFGLVQAKAAVDRIAELGCGN